MRRTRLLPALAVLILSACNHQLIDSPQLKGEVTFSLSAEDRVEVSVKSGTETALPDVADFWIEVVNSGNVKFFREKYADVVGKKFSMNAGEFTFMAKHGDSLGVGFNKPFYMAKEQFTVEPQGTASVSGVAKLANVKVAVNYGETIKQDYSGFYTVINHVKYADKSLKFTEDETRDGYIPGGKLTLTVYAMVEGELKCYTLKDQSGNVVEIEAEPNDYITFNVNTGINYGGLAITMYIDDEVELVEKTFEVPADAASNSRPSILLSSVDEDGTYYITEGVQAAPADLGFTYKAYAGFAKCELSVESDYLKGLGVPEVIDLKNLDNSLAATLESVGFFLAESGNIGVVGIEDIVYEYSKTAQYLGGGKPTVMGSFTLDIEDLEGYKVTETIDVVVSPDAKASISVNDYDIWARRVNDAAVTVDKGNVSLMDLQSSTDGEVWNDFKQVTSAYFQLGTITGLEPATDYYLRVVYDDWMVISDVKKITTEQAQQVGNAGFEYYHQVQTDFTPVGGALGGGTYTRNWYQPFANGESDKWWACNSMQSMPDGHTGWTSTWCKNFPSSGYVTDAHSGSKAAFLYCVNIGNTNTDGTAVGTTYEGELWIGTADGSGNHATEGHAFSSRPDKLAFWYKYSPNSSNKFFVDSWVKAADGTVIATAQETAGPAASSWTKHTLTYTYSTTEKKASQIYIRISSCYGDGDVSTGKSFTLGTESVKAHAGSFLTLDDIELIYE